MFFSFFSMQKNSNGSIKIFDVEQTMEPEVHTHFLCNVERTFSVMSDTLHGCTF